MINTREITQGCHVYYGDDIVKVEDVGYLRDKPVVVVNWVGRTATMPQSLDAIPINVELLDKIMPKEGRCEHYPNCHSYIWGVGNFIVNINIIGEKIHASILHKDESRNDEEVAHAIIEYLHELEAIVYITTKKPLYE